MSLRKLIVDDDKIHCFIHESLLNKSNLGGESYTFYNGKDALEFIVENDDGGEFLVLLDINMPVMNGWQFMDEVKQGGFKSKIKVVMVTSSVDHRDQSKAYRYDHLVGYIQKPLITDSLEEIKKMSEQN